VAPSFTFVHIIRPTNTDYVHSLTAKYGLAPNFLGWVLDSITLIPYHYKLANSMNFMAAPCISNIKHFIVQLMHKL